MKPLSISALAVLGAVSRAIRYGFDIMRTAISRLREIARASSRFATFAHAITNTNDTTMSIARKMTRPLRGIISS